MSSAREPRATVSPTSRCAARAVPCACFPFTDGRGTTSPLPLRYPDELALPLRRRRPPVEEARTRLPHGEGQAPALAAPRDRRAHQEAVRACARRRRRGGERLPP